MHVYVYVYVFVFVYVYVCVCGGGGGGGQSQEKLLWRLQEMLTRKSFVKLFFMGAKDKSNHLTAGSLQRFPRITGA